MSGQAYSLATSSNCQRDKTYDVLCPDCHSIFDEAAVRVLQNRSGGHVVGQRRLHLTFGALMKSAEQSCHLCNLIFGCLQNSLLYAQTNHRGSELGGSIDLKETQLFMTISPTDLVISGDHVYKSSILWGSLEITPIGAREMDNLVKSRFSLPDRLHAYCLKGIESWIADCLADHQICSNSWKYVSERRRLPTRLLALSHQNGTPHLRILDTTILPVDTKYVTLSHCWGTKRYISLLVSKISAFSQSVPFESLPQTFRHAVEVTMLFQCQYLWIDSLCIIQDSKDDWIRESSLMGQVYANAYLNIAATASSDGDGGLFHREDALLANPCIINARANDSTTLRYICHRDRVWEREIESAPLGKRAWVMQERILSPRTVHFTSEQVFWECCESSAAELFPQKSYGRYRDYKKLKQPSDGTRNRGPYFVYNDWHEMVERYTKCNLTFGSDKLPALSGLAQRVCRQLNEDPSAYLAGLWRSNLPRDLLWCVAIDTPTKREPGRGPSWAWSSIDGPIWPGSRREASIVYTRILDAKTIHEGDPFGKVHQGYIRLEGPLSLLHLAGAKGRSSLEELFGGKMDGDAYPPTIPWKFIHWDDAASSVAAEDNSVLFLLIEMEAETQRSRDPIQSSGLVLQPTRVKRGQYKRLGKILSIIDHLGTFLDNARNPELLGETLYEKADCQHGFTIELV